MINVLKVNKDEKKKKFFTIESACIKKSKLFEDILKMEPTIIEKIEEALNKECVVYAIKDKKTFKAIYFFDEKINDENKLLKYKNNILLEELSDKKIEKYEKQLIDTLKDVIIFNNEYESVEFKGEIMSQQTVKLGDNRISMSLFCVVAGIIIGIIFDSFFWFMIGILFAYELGVVIKSKKRKK